MPLAHVLMPPAPGCGSSQSLLYLSHALARWGQLCLHLHISDSLAGDESGFPPTPRRGGSVRAPVLCHQLAFAPLPAQGWKGLADPLAFHPAPSHLQQHGRHWRLELAARKLFPGSAPLGRLPSPPPHKHVTAQRVCGGVKPHKPPAPSRESSVGGMARVLLRNAYVCKVLGCWGGSWGAGSQEREVSWIWDHWGQRLGSKGKTALLLCHPRSL